MAGSALRLIADSVAPIGLDDIVQTGDNSFPRYRVIAINGDRAWLRDVQYGSDEIVPMARISLVDQSPSNVRKARSRNHRLLDVSNVSHLAGALGRGAVVNSDWSN